MNFELEYRYALECELNHSQRNCDNVRNQLLQLVASRRSLPSAAYHERLKDLLGEYSLEIDKKTGLNTFIDSSLKIVQHECQREEFFVDKWRSAIKNKLDDGVKVHPRPFDKMKEISDKFRRHNRERLILLQTEESAEQFIQPSKSDDEDSENVNPRNVQRKCQKCYFS